MRSEMPTAYSEGSADDAQRHLFEDQKQTYMPIRRRGVSDPFPGEASYEGRLGGCLPGPFRMNHDAISLRT